MNENHFLQKIIAERIPCYFISPHLDDAILSAGGLIAYLSPRTRVEGVSVFTSASSEPYTFSVRQFLRQCGYKNADQLYSNRKEEDNRAFALAHIVPHHLEHIDAAWRKITAPSLIRRALSRIFPEFLHLYPLHRIHIARGKVSPHDATLMRSIGEKLKALVAKEKQYVVFCPLAIKSHIDHVLVRDVCLAHFNNVILWEDFPYNVKSALSVKDTAPFATEIFRFEEESETKRRMINTYSSQVKAMFPDGDIPSMPEVYYSPLKGSGF